MARKGDLIVVNPQRVGGSVREGEIIEVIEADLRVQYRVRWNDGHESLFAPGAGGARIEPRESPAKASTARKSRAKEASAKTTTTGNSTPKRSNAKTAKRSSPGRRR